MDSFFITSLNGLFKAKSISCNLSVQFAGMHTYSTLLLASYSLQLSTQWALTAIEAGTPGTAEAHWKVFLSTII